MSGDAVTPKYDGASIVYPARRVTDMEVVAVQPLAKFHWLYG